MNDSEIWKELKTGSTFHMPATYPDGSPLYWKHEASGVMAGVIHAFVGEFPLDGEQLRLLKEYIAHWIQAPCWRWETHKTPASQFLARLARAQNREDVWAVLHPLFDETGMDPL